LTNKRKIYLDLFNLNENASLEEIKKRFRELAKEFHPDRNKENNAHERFLLIKEAYEYLINNQIYESKNLFYENINLEKERIEKIRLAKERLKEYYKRKEIKLNLEIDNYFKSLNWKIFIVTTILSTVLSLLIFVELFLSTKIENNVITCISQEYNSINDKKIVLITTIDNKNFFTNSSIKQFLNQNDSIQTYKTKLLNRYAVIKGNNNTTQYVFYNLNNSLLINILFILIFLLPLFTFLYKTKNIGYTILANLITTIYLPLLICFVTI
jgi:curved DNA-binding protein CbpA